ncbi:MAG: hypothetical protein Q8P90_02190, partial [bacterium]|nr:hypothetical protein [bacterium]
MKEQPHYTNLLTEEFFLKHYVEKRMSYPKIAEMLKDQGYNIAIGTLYQYANKLGIGRSRSEAKRNREPNPLDYNVSYMCESMTEVIDGFLLGDGSIYKINSNVLSGRATFGLEHEEFCRYLMSFFQVYQPYIKDYKSKNMKSGIVWDGKTKSHPDLYKQ